MRIAVVSFDYRIENLWLMPWRYVREISRCLIELENEVTIITDGLPRLPKNDRVEGVPITRVHQVKHFPPRYFYETIRAIEEVDPDAVLWLMGLTNFFQKGLYERLGYNIVALVGSPVYSLKELMTNLSISDILHNIRQLKTTFAETLSPRSLIRDTFNLDSIKAVVTMSQKKFGMLERHWR